MQRRIFRTISAACIATAIAFTGAGVADAAQGGLGVGKAWFKVARSELNQRSAQAACEATGVSKWNCQPMAAAVNRERSKNPNATGYWAEFFVIGTTRSGTW